MARRHTGELTLVAAGPPTHLALQYDPEPVDHVKAVAVMAGAFGENGHRGNVSPVAKANIASDPHAADRVFTARWPVTIVGLDVTHEVLPTPPRSTRSAVKVVPRTPSSARSHTAATTPTDRRAAAASFCTMPVRSRVPSTQHLSRCAAVPCAWSPRASPPARPSRCGKARVSPLPRGLRRRPNRTASVSMHQDCAPSFVPVSFAESRCRSASRAVSIHPSRCVAPTRHGLVIPGWQGPCSTFAYTFAFRTESGFT